MHRIRHLLKGAFTPVTIMLIPHSDRKPFNLKIPYLGIFISIILCAVGTIYVLSIAVDAFEYNMMKDRLGYYSNQFLEMKATISALKKAEVEFRRLFSLNSREKVLESVDTSDSGAIDIETLKLQIKKSIESVSEIKDYLSQQRDLYMATPKGWPVKGIVTSGYGKRTHPKTGEEDFHTGIDISSRGRSPVTATADGIVSFSGWDGGSGNLVVIEHGFGYSTLYAHNKMIVVQVGQRVKRGDIIAYVGSTGNTTGPHLHYEVWKNGSPVNPKSFLEGRN